MSLLRACRNHIHFLVIAPLLIIVMTWPTFLYVFDTNTFWLPSGNNDVYYKIWDAWYGWQALAGGADLLYTDLLFYPQGLSLVYHQFSIPQIIVASLLQAVMPATNAYNTCFLLILFLNAWSTYLLLTHIFRDKWICLFGAALVGASPLFLYSSTLPDLTLIATLPLTLYFFQRSIIERRRAFAVYAGLAAGATVFIGMYVFVCIVLTLALYGLYFAYSRWRNRLFWIRIAILLCALGVVSMLRIGPMIADRDALSEVLDKQSNSNDANDLLGFFLLPTNPISDSLREAATAIEIDERRDRAYLGFVPLLLILAGLARRSIRRQMLPWLVIFLFFLLLSLGRTLVINTVPYPNIPLPKHLLDQLYPALFKSFWDAKHFQIGALIPLAILSCYGLGAVLNSLARRRAAWLVLALVALCSIEYYTPTDGKEFAIGKTEFLQWLKTEDQVPIRLIHFPMDEESVKYYMFLQSMSGYALVNGTANRTPRESYSYIGANPILNAWRENRNFFCFPTSAKDFDDALAELLADGFTHIILHEPLKHSKLLPVMFPHTLPAYKDDFVYVYRLPDMRDTCHHSAFLSDDVFPQLYAQLPPASLRLGDNATVLSIHPAAEAVADAVAFYARVMERSPALLPLTIADIRDNSAGTNESESELERQLTDNRVVLLVYDPGATPPDLIEAYTDWIETRFKGCNQSAGTTSLGLQYFVTGDIRCDLLHADEPLAVRYENGMKLANAMLEMDGRQLELRLLWERLTRELHSVSLQVFDETGTHVAGIDRTIPRHDGPAFDLQLDLASLEPGEYTAKLIVYNYETRDDVPGMVASREAAFARALELDRVTIE